LVVSRFVAEAECGAGDSLRSAMMEGRLITVYQQSEGAQ